eukprot:scaffold52257_cov31-Tisochrysis_lutea.AAC.2
MLAIELKKSTIRWRGVVGGGGTGGGGGFSGPERMELVRVVGAGDRFGTRRADAGCGRENRGHRRTAPAKAL